MTTGDLVTEDWGFEYRGFAFGGTSDYLVAPGVTGLFDLPEIVTSDQQRLRRHGLHPGDDFMLSREIVIPLEITADDTATWEANLQALKTAMAVDPERDTAEDPLVFQVPGIAEGRKVRIDARPRGLAGPLDLTWFYEIPTVNLRFFSTKPWVYDISETTVTSPILAGSSSGLTWPLTWPLVWGTVTASSFTATNDGTSRAEFIATIPGPVTNPVIQHLDRGVELAFAIDLEAGQYLEVDTESRTVLLNGTANRYYVKSGTWFNLAPGDNLLSYRADAGSSNLSIVYRSTWS
jgi:hypothetical protein